MNWAEENLKVSKFQNGDNIFEAKDNRQWVELGYAKLPAFMVTEFGEVHYNFYAVTDGRKLSPKGYRLPTYYELNSFINNKESFSELPRLGYRVKGLGILNGVGSQGLYWTKTSVETNKIVEPLAYYLYIDSHSTRLLKEASSSGFSVRCLIDNT